MSKNLDCLEIKGIVVNGCHGLTEPEKINPQPFKVDVYFYGDFQSPAITDDIEQSVDYRNAVEIVKQVISGDHINLLEKLNLEISSKLSHLASKATCWISEVEVVVAKIAPPVEDVTEVSFKTKVPVKRKAYLGIGSNMGDRWKAIRFALNKLPDLSRVSSVYETSPVGGPPQENYLNLVVELFTEKHPEDLLKIANEIEKEAGRVRDSRWGPRVLDIDVLKVGELRLQTKDLILPHPRMWERRFVLIPLAELVPDLVKQEELLAAVGEVKKVGRI